MKSAIPAAALDVAKASRKHGEDNRSLRPAHGFIGDTNAGPFTTIDAPRAGLLTAAFGIENDGRTVGAYVDTDGRLHGFLRTADRFRTIDVPGAGLRRTGCATRRYRLLCHTWLGASPRDAQR
jgi:hypothetical protein